MAKTTREKTQYPAMAIAIPAGCMTAPDGKNTGNIIAREKFDKFINIKRLARACSRSMEHRPAEHHAQGWQRAAVTRYFI